MAVTLRRTASALALAVALTSTRANALDLDANDGLSTDTIASRDRLRVWDNAARYGAETVGDRDRADAKPDGVRMGNYLVFPEAAALVTFDDNIFARDIDKVSDWRTDLSGGIKFASHLPRHVLDFSLDGKVVTYLENSEQDYANLRAKLNGALHFDNAHTLSASFLSAIEHEERNDPSLPLSRRSVTAEGPIEVFHNRASVGITRDVGRLYGTVSATAESWDSQDTNAIDGTPLDLDPADMKTFSTTAKFGYRFSPGFEWTGKVRGYRDLNRGDTKTDRDAWGYEAVTGIVFEANPLLRWRVLGGFGVRDYEQTDLATVATTLAAAEVEWLPTQRLTIYATLQRQILDAATLEASGVVQTGVKIRAEYEIYHNLVLTGGVELREDKIPDVDQPDQIAAARIGLDYYYSKNWLFTFAYEHQVRDSSDDSLDMHRNRFMIGAKLRF